MNTKHREAAHRDRPIIFNNDGDDTLYFPKEQEVTPANFLKTRNSLILNTDVSTLFYCSTLPFGLFEHNTQIGEVFSRREPIEIAGLPPNTRPIIADLIELGTDPLAVVSEFCRANGIEVFSSIRMNDIHDGAGFPVFMPEFKRKHPEYLFGTEAAPPPYGYWTGVDYARPEIREEQFRFIADICSRYDIDGIELDFWRHPPFFRRQAWGQAVLDEELARMTDLVRRIRGMTLSVEERRGRPFLMAVRALESSEISRHCGLDIVRWLEEGLIDILVTGEFTLGPWEDMIALGHRYDVPVYPCIRRAPGDDAARQTIESYRGQALHAWRIGADGVYFFNLFPEDRTDVFEELGSPARLAREDKLYHVYPAGHVAFERYIPDVYKLATMPTLGPKHPSDLTAGTPYQFPIYVADTLDLARPDLDIPRATLRMDVQCATGADGLRASINSHELRLIAASGDQLEANVPVGWLKAGLNQIEVCSTSTVRARLMDISLQLGYRGRETRPSQS